MTFEIKAVEPVGEETSPALVKRAGKPCSLEQVTNPVYPPSRGRELRDARVTASVSVRVLAAELGMSAVDLSAVEHGRASFVDEADWDRVLAATKEAAPTT